MPPGEGDRRTDERHTRLYCSFCGKSQEQVRKLVAGPKSHICDECIEVCVDIISDDRIAHTPHAEQAKLVREGSRVLTARCSLCRMPVVIQDLLAVIGRGSVCVSCIAAVQAIRLPIEGPNDTQE
jgi:hypothetical protein